MSTENKKSDAEEILAEFQKTNEVESTEEPQLSQSEPVVESESTENKERTENHNIIFVGTKPIMVYVTAMLTQLGSLPIVTIRARGKRITQAIDISQMIVKRMDQVGFEIGDIRISSDSLVSKDGQKRNVSNIEIDIKNISNN